MKIQDYKPEIVKLNPLDDSKFVYDKVRWVKLNEEAKSYIKEFENKAISRKDVINGYKEYYENGISFIKPFTLTMIWGFADTGYGTFRTNKYLETAGNDAKIVDSLNILKTGDLKRAFDYLINIDGLNISYISKILYFATKALNPSQEYALIFDIRVARALIKLTTPNEILELVEIYPSTEFEDYGKYNKLLHQWAKELDVEADAIEMFLFDLK